MAEFEIPKHGQICWRELATTDLPGAKGFYQKLFGWTLERSKVSTAPAEYSEIHIDGRAVGGMMAIDETWGENPPPTHWSTYIAVGNVDESVAKINDNGGSVRFGPFDAPSVGRIALVSDPGGANFAVIQFERPT